MNYTVVLEEVFRVKLCLQIEFNFLVHVDRYAKVDEFILIG